MSTKAVLAIGGSDPTGAAGIAADLKTIHACGGYGGLAVTSVTAQSSSSVASIAPVDPDQVALQIECICRELNPRSWKVGMAFSSTISMAIAAKALEHRPEHLIVDPVGAASNGDSLVEGKDLLDVYAPLLELATLITPNALEAGELLGRRIGDQYEMADAAKAICGLGARWTLIKGGHLDHESGTPERCTDLLSDGQRSYVISAPWLTSPDMRGTGCTLASATATLLAQGRSVPESLVLARRYLSGAITTGALATFSSGKGALGHFWAGKAELQALFDEPVHYGREDRFGVLLIDVPAAH